MTDEIIEEVSRVAASIRPILADREVMVQAAILADLLALYLAGWPREAREEQLEKVAVLARFLTRAKENSKRQEA
jgi:hypothetical protein